MSYLTNPLRETPDPVTLLPIPCAVCEGNGTWVSLDRAGNRFPQPCPACDGVGQIRDDAADEPLEVLVKG